MGRASARPFSLVTDMANEQNLIPQAHVLTVEEQSRGGKKSGEKRSLKGLTRQWAEAGGYEEMVQVAKEHLDNPRFWEMLASLLGEGPTQRIEADINQIEIKVHNVE